MQALVGGLVEQIYCETNDNGTGVVVLFNEEGRLHLLQPNRFLPVKGTDTNVGYQIVGNMVLVATDRDGEWTGLSPMQVKQWLHISDAWPKLTLAGAQQ